MRILICMSALVLAGCGPSPSAEKVAKQEAAPATAPVKDHTSMMPAVGLTGATVVRDHILGQEKLPGGTLGNYETHGKKYQLFIIDTADNQSAAFLLLDAKSALRSPEYISHMGGYFGSDGNRPIYVFAKLHYLAGVAGLSREDADPIARVLAVRLR
jgi:hypothetical protein